VTDEAQSAENAYQQLMTPTTGPAPSAVPAVKKSRHTSASSARAAGLSADPTDGKAQAAALAKLAMPIYYPRLIAGDSQYCSDLGTDCYEYPNPGYVYNGSYPRAYTIHDQSGVPHFAYRMTLVVNPVLGEYYGVQGTTWRDPPILRVPQQVRTVHGKHLLLFLDGRHINLVGWRTAQAAYWVSNTLNDALSNPAMIDIAASLTKAA